MSDPRVKCQQPHVVVGTAELSVQVWGHALGGLMQKNTTVLVQLSSESSKGEKKLVL